MAIPKLRTVVIEKPVWKVLSLKRLRSGDFGIERIGHIDGGCKWRLCLIEKAASGRELWRGRNPDYTTLRRAKAEAHALAKSLQKQEPA